MKNAILLHGKPDKEEYFDPHEPSLSNAHWFPWLQKQLLINGIDTQTPEIYESFNPQYNIWKREIERYDVNENTILVGHSCGGGFLIRWLSENKDITLDKLVLVAPWLDPDKDLTSKFFNFGIDPDLQKRVREIHIFISKDDDSDIHETVNIIRKTFPNAKIHEFEDKGHFTQKMKLNEFPELLETILK